MSGLPGLVKIELLRGLNIHAPKPYIFQQSIVELIELTICLPSCSSGCEVAAPSSAKLVEHDLILSISPVSAGSLEGVTGFGQRALGVELTESVCK